MKYTVVWTTSARNELNEIWVKATDKRAVTDASNRVETLLKYDADKKGEASMADVY